MFIFSTSINTSSEDRFWIVAVFRRTNLPFEVIGRPDDVPARVMTFFDTWPVSGRIVPGRCRPVDGRPPFVVGRKDRLLEFILRLNVLVPGRASSLITLCLNSSSAYSYVSISRSSMNPCSNRSWHLSNHTASSWLMESNLSRIISASAYFFRLYNLLA